MHYIIGTRFDVDIRHTGATDSKSMMARRYKKYFPENGAYEIWYIKPDKNGVEYTFMHTQTRQVHKHTFKSTREADDILAVFTGETVPDYDKMYAEEASSALDQ